MKLSPLVAALVSSLVTGSVAAAEPSVAVVRSRMGGLLVAPASGPNTGVTRWLGGASPEAFGRRDGSLRVLGVSSTRREVLVVVDDGSDGELFALAVGGAEPRRVCAASRVELDPAMSGDGQRLAFVSRGELRVADLRPGAGACRTVAVALDGERLTRPRWIGDALVFERDRRDAGRTTSVIHRVPADGSSASRPVLPDRTRASQDRAQLALPDGRVVMYSDGVPGLGGATGFEPLAGLHGAHLHGRVRGGLLVTLGRGGVDRRAALGVLGDDGALRRVGHEEDIWLDPVASPDGEEALWTVKRAAGYRVEAVSLVEGTAEPVSGFDARPVLLIAWGPRGETLYGCRGEEVVAVARGGGLRVLTTVPGAPSCPVRAVVAGVAGPVAVYYAQDDGEMRPALLTDGASGPRLLPRGTSIAGVVGGSVVLNAGGEPARIVVVGGDRERTLVPWMTEGVSEAWRGDGVVAWRGRFGGPLRAVDLAGGVVRVVAAEPGDISVLGLSGGHLVAFDPRARRVVSYRLDGADAARPRSVLDGVTGGVWLSASGRVVAVAARPDSAGAQRAQAVSARVDGSERDAPRLLMAGAPHVRSFQYDATHDQVVAVEALVAASGHRIIAARVDGSERDAPRVIAELELGVDLTTFVDCAFSEIAATEAGVVLVHRRQSMNVPAVCRQLLVPWSGGPARPHPMRYFDWQGPPVPATHGAEVREYLP